MQFINFNLFILPKMYGILPLWIKLWLFCSFLICSFDVSFTMLRPDSLRGGKFAKYYSIWHIYSDIDLRYGDSEDPITMATGSLMCVELLLNLIALFLDFFRRAHFHSLMAAFTTSALVFWKTCLYLALNLIPKLFGGKSFIASGIPLWREFAFFWIPNSLWVFIPLAAMICLWKRIESGWKLEKAEFEENSEEKFSKCLHFEKFDRIVENGNGLPRAMDELENVHLIRANELNGGEKAAFMARDGDE